MIKRTKTFGLRTPNDLYKKLLFDLDRLNNSTTSETSVYAAFDCAVTATHIAEWVIHAATPSQHLKLTGKRSGHEKALKGFGELNEDRLLALKFCRQIANAVKHVVITRSKEMENVYTGKSIKFDPPLDFSKPESVFPPGQKFLPFVYIAVDDNKYPVADLFRDMAAQWHDFLDEEGFFDEQRERAEYEASAHSV